MIFPAFQEKLDKKESIEQICKDIISESGNVESIVISYVNLEDMVYTFNSGSIPCNLGMLECLKKEILNKWEGSNEL